MGSWSGGWAALGLLMDAAILVLSRKSLKFLLRCRAMFLALTLHVISGRHVGTWLLAGKLWQVMAVPPSLALVWQRTHLYAAVVSFCVD